MPINLELLVRPAVRALVNYRYHHLHMKIAKGILKTIEGVKCPLPQIVVRQCDDDLPPIPWTPRYATATLASYSAVE
jgi:hypothetical protein